MTGIAKPPSPFRKVDPPMPQQQQQQRKSTSTIPQHFRPQPVVEQPFVPPSNPSWSPAQTTPGDVNARPGGTGSLAK